MGSAEAELFLTAIAAMLSPTTLTFSVLALVLGERPMRPDTEQQMVDKVSGLASSPAVAVLGAGAALANPGGFIPIALKDISQLNPSASEYIALWVGFGLVSLLPLIGALVAIGVSREWAVAKLERARGWLERHARTMAAAIILLLAAALVR